MMTCSIFRSIITALTFAVPVFFNEPSTAAYAFQSRQRIPSLSKRTIAKGLEAPPIIPLEEARPSLISVADPQAAIEENYASSLDEPPLNSQQMFLIGKCLGIDGNYVFEIMFPGWRNPASLEWLQGIPSNPADIQRIKQGLYWYETRFDRAHMSESSKRALARNIKIMRSALAKPAERRVGEYHPNWLNMRLRVEWTTYDTAKYGFGYQTLSEFGKALGIEDTGVRPMTQEAYDELRKVPIPLWIPDATENTARDAIFKFFKKANFASLSTEDQKVLEFNLASIDRRPWWTNAHMKYWQWTMLPYPVMAPIGTLLKFFERGKADTETVEEIVTIRREILRILEDYVEREPIEIRMHDSLKTVHGAIAEHLHQATLSVKQDLKGFTSEYLHRYSKIQPDEDEIASIREHIDSNSLALASGGPKGPNTLREVIHMMMLLAGIPPGIGMEYGRALHFVWTNSKVRLIMGGKQAREARKMLLPKPKRLWGDINWAKMQPLLENFFSELVGDEKIKSAILKSEGPFSLKLSATRIQTGLKTLWIELKGFSHRL